MAATKMVPTAHATPADEARRRYAPPTLRRGPELAAVSAQTTTLTEDSIGPCWVARAAFGADDLRWMVFRAWLLEDAPAWFRALYLAHGRELGAWLAEKPAARALVRRAMMRPIRRKLVV